MRYTHPTIMFHINNLRGLGCLVDIYHPESKNPIKTPISIAGPAINVEDIADLLY